MSVSLDPRFAGSVNQSQRKSYGSQKAPASRSAIDPDVAELHDQVDEIEESIARVASEMKTETSLFESELERLQSEVEKKRIETETELSAIVEQNMAKLKEISEENEAELDDFRQRLEETRREKSNFMHQHGEVSRVNKEAEIAALRAQLERRRIKHRDQEFAATTSTQRDKMERQQREAELQAQIEIINAEISEVAASRNEELQRARIKLDETSATFATRQREQAAKMDRYKDEIAKREAQYGEQAKALEIQKQMEHDQLENELKAMNEKLQGLQHLYSKIEKRNNRELQITQQDIERMNEAIEQMKQREEEQIEEAKEQISQYQDAQHDNIAIEQQIEAIRQEIARIKRDNVEMRKERQRLDTMIYSSRISRHKSLR